MADPAKPIPQNVLAQVNDVSTGLHAALTGTGNSGKSSGTYNIAAEAEATSRGKTTLNDAQKAEYDNAMQLYKATGDRLYSTKWSGADIKNRKAWLGELEKIDKMPEADRTAVLGRLMYHGAHQGESGTSMLADISNHAKNSNTMLFTDQKGKNVSFEKLLSEGINVNRGEGTTYDIQQNPNLFKDVQDRAGQLHQLDVKDAKAAGRQR